MKQIQNILLLGIIALGTSLIVSCDKVDDPFEGIDTGGNDTSVIANADSIWGDTGNTTIRKMMIEEVTGQLCGNCPPKTKLIVDWVETEHKGKVYSVAYHATDFARPNPKYPDDHRTEKGTAFNSSFGNTDAPVAIFCRQDLNGSGLIVQGAKFVTEFNKLVSNGFFNDPKVQIKILNIYDRDNKSNRIVITATALKALTETHTAIIYISENPVLGDQKYYSNPNGPDDIFDTYEHPHVFRGAVGSLDGNSFIQGNLAAGESVSESFNVTLDTTKWDPAKVNFTVAIRNNTTGEIIQVDEVHARK
ncbi:MAG: hypothetical protein CL840_02865 [Crocinitomicaceae bacterium]|nr:hypothetical protein [Crocinitomicaceae bacterium]|tara:strand:+ start:40756 stop:41670 length:915 start_codon:yes stop_codon:yes gene_type:complete